MAIPYQTCQWIYKHILPRWDNDKTHHLFSPEMNREREMGVRRIEVNYSDLESQIQNIDKIIF